ncbi:MAG: hypothetical protein GY711_18885 [bacterium]|nr:hypothetical protein [bacterium]
MYRTTPLRAVFRREGFGYYHDGRFPTLDHVVTHYDQAFQLGLSTTDKDDLIEYLKSL